MSPSPAADPSQVANSVVTWSGFVLAGFSFLLTVFTAFVLLAGIFGLREIRNIRKAGQEVGERASKILDEANAILEQLRGEVAGIDARMNSLVEVSYLFNQGQLAYRAGEFKNSADLLTRAAQLDPNNGRILYRLGRALTIAGEVEAASERFQEMKALDPDSGTPERGLAYVHRYSNPDLAMRYAMEATVAGPEDARNWNCLGLMQRDAGQLAESAKSHERAAQLQPDSMITPFYLALLHARQGAEERGRNDCSAAVYRLRSQERSSPVKSIWADVILWAEQIFAGNYDAADRLCASLVESCTSRRRAREVGGHIDFLLRALQRETLLRRYLGPLDERWPLQPGE